MKNLLTGIILLTLVSCGESKLELRLQEIENKVFKIKINNIMKVEWHEFNRTTKEIEIRLNTLEHLDSFTKEEVATYKKVKKQLTVK